MKLIRHRNMRDVAFFPTNIKKLSNGDYKLFGWWYSDQLKDLMNVQETIIIKSYEAKNWFGYKPRIFDRLSNPAS